MYNGLNSIHMCEVNIRKNSLNNNYHRYKYNLQGSQLVSFVVSNKGRCIGRSILWNVDIKKKQLDSANLISGR